MEAAGWYDSMVQLQQSQYRTLQHRRSVTTVERSNRGEGRQPLTPLNWDVATGQIRGRPREIKRGNGGGTGKGRTGSQVPDLTRQSLVTDGKDEKRRDDKGIGGLRRSARRSLSRSRLIQAVLAVPRKANEGMKWWRDEEKDKSGEYGYGCI